MMLHYLAGSSLLKLKASVDANLPQYLAGEELSAQYAPTEGWIKESGIVVGPPPVLLRQDSNEALPDAECAIRIFTWLNALSPVLAMEERLWSHLTHYVFADYMRVRWPVESSHTVVRRFFMENRSFAALARNGISRLWWAAHLTVDPSREDRFERTKTLFLRQDVQVGLLERAIGKCNRVRFGVLDYLRENPGLQEKENFGRRIQVMLRELNLLGGVMILDALSEQAVAAQLRAINDRIDSGLLTI